MGDVFDAMNRAKRERSGQPQSNEIPVFPAPTEPTPQPDGDTKPALPIDEVRDQPDHLYDKPSDTSGERHEADLPSSISSGIGSEHDSEQEFEDGRRL